MAFPIITVSFDMLKLKHAGHALVLTRRKAKAVKKDALVHIKVPQPLPGGHTIVPFAPVPLTEVSPG